MTPIWTPRLWLTPIAEHDLNTLHALVLRVLVDKPFPREIVALETRASIERFAAGGMGIYLAWRRATGELLGFAGARPYVEAEVQLACGFDRKFCGDGLATEACTQVLARLLAERERVHAIADEDDVALRRLYERLGMTHRPGEGDGRALYTLTR